jgi:hypothetical protein
VLVAVAHLQMCMLPPLSCSPLEEQTFADSGSVVMMKRLSLQLQGHRSRSRYLLTSFTKQFSLTSMNYA